MKGILSFILILSGFATALAQELSFSTEVDTTQMRIGEQINLMMRGEVAEGQGFTWPFLPDTITGIELVKAGEIDTTKRNGRWVIEQNLVITSFDSGYAVIPPLTLKTENDSASSLAIGIAVHLPELSEEDQLYDIKKPLEAPANWWPLILGILGVLVVAALIGYLIYYLRRRRKREKLTPEQVLPPYDYAQLQLQEIEREKLWQNGKVKEYYSRLTDVLRLYMERQMQVNAMESTADEVITQVQRMNLPQDLKQKVRTLMHLSALVKYAKEKPTESDHETSMLTVREFLEKTKPREEETGEEK